MVIVGDFNVWAESVNTNSVKLNDLMTSFGLLQLVNDPTHEDDTLSIMCILTLIKSRLQMF